MDLFKHHFLIKGENEAEEITDALRTSFFMGLF